MTVDPAVLSHRQRAVFVRRMAGQSQQEIADALGIGLSPEKKVEQLIREKLDPWWEGPSGQGFWIVAARAYEHGLHGVTCEVEG